MKKKKYRTAINSTAVNATGVYSPLSLLEGEREAWVRLTPYGEFPVTLGDGKRVMQVMDATAANAMIKNFNSLLGKIVTWNKGLPYLEGHPDDAAWAAANGGGTGKALGRIKELEAREDGLYGRTVFNSAGVELLTGESPAYTGHSPHWRMQDIAGQAHKMRPVLLISMGLTNTPNIRNNGIALNSAGEAVLQADEESPQTTENQTIMLNKELLKKLGLDENADQAAIEAAISAVLAKVDEQKNAVDKATADTAAANTSRDALQAELDKLQGNRVETAINAAITAGKITAAEKDKWTTALNTNFDATNDLLDSLKPALNTSNSLPNLRERKGEEKNAGTSATNSAVAEFAKQHGLDLNIREGYDKAWLGAKKTNPDLFKD